MKIFILKIKYVENCTLSDEEKKELEDYYVGSEYLSDEVFNDELFEEVNKKTNNQIAEFMYQIEP